jgi:hypothetical protein
MDFSGRRLDMRAFSFNAEIVDGFETRLVSLFG